ERLPLLRGDLRIDRARYERPIQLSPTLGQLYRPQRAEVERYDPEADNVRLDLRVRNRAPIRVVNNLLDVDLRIDDGDRPFRVVGTDQRYGVVGNVRIARGTVRFRNTELDVTRGEVRLDDETRVDPRFDVVAETEIRRQQTQADLTAPAWRVQVRAHGNLDAFRLDATSQPALSQEDLMLLLTVGMTSAEAQQLQAGELGGTALEALSAISGVNEEVTNAVRVIDEFAITTRYSPQTGRPEPMVTIGKRITDRVRMSASTGMTGEERTFQTGVEWQVGDQTSIQMLYDNINRESSSSFGNVGVDFHWRLEFE
ncbi:MAG TPA: translocation/assembly module TamB domain-containing protein, partial [Polyangiaceae bacterium LLY-WYZ-15_(1-7)]|nr:translocation/assembly module TamB domain-containing protein [Polyangiaceae bacterium LLY-WYZ-15_(1-7)]